MTSNGLIDEEATKLTLEQWLLKTNELGYLITQPRVVYEPKGWKAVAEFAAIMVCFGLFVGGASGGLLIAATYFDNKTKCEQRQ